MAGFFISLKPITEKAGIFQESIISEKIGDDYDGIIELEKVVEWLLSNGYKCEQ